jgi:hypothetical protein
MKAWGIFPFTSAKPFMAPTTAPVRRMTGIVTRPPNSGVAEKTSAPVTVERARTEPTERSMPATRITKSIPMARVARTAVWSEMFVRFLTVRNSGASSENPMARRRSMMPGPILISVSAPRIVRSEVVPAPPASTVPALTRPPRSVHRSPERIRPCMDCSCFSETSVPLFLRGLPRPVEPFAFSRKPGRSRTRRGATPRGFARPAHSSTSVISNQYDSAG